MGIIVAEVSKFCADRRLNERNVAELDKRIAVEIYLKEKKDAILEDRRNGVEQAAIGPEMCKSSFVRAGGSMDVETTSNLQVVRAKYRDFTENVTSDNMTKISLQSQTAQSNATRSQVGSTVQERAAELTAIA